MTVESGDLLREDYVQKFQDQVGSYLLDTDTLEEKMEKIGRLKQIIDMMQGMATETKLGKLIEAEEMKPKQVSEPEKEEDIHKNKDEMMENLAQICLKVENVTSDDLTQIEKEEKTDELNMKEPKTEGEVKKTKELNVDVVNPE